MAICKDIHDKINQNCKETETKTDLAVKLKYTQNSLKTKLF